MVLRQAAEEAHISPISSHDSSCASLCLADIAHCVFQVVEELVSRAGPGEAHEHTLLLVFGDHGQTLTGDHGGGAPEEVDSALFALNVGAYHKIRSAHNLH